MKNQEVSDDHCLKVNQPDTLPGYQITPEMIKVGSEIVAWYDERFDTREEIARRIYAAMREAGGDASSEAP